MQGGASNAPTGVKDMRHIGLIPDGARRWARARGVSYTEAYRRTMAQVATWTDHCFAQGLSSVSIYLASADNLTKRAAPEVEAFLSAELYLVEELFCAHSAKWRPFFNFCGVESDKTRAIRQAAGRMNSAAQGEKIVNLLIGYDPWAEITHACASGQFDRSRLWVSQSLDCIIRTGTEGRLSNFLPLQSGYAELQFLPDLFLDVNDARFQALLRSVQERPRMLGE